MSLHKLHDLFRVALSALPEDVVAVSEVVQLLLPRGGRAAGVASGACREGCPVQQQHGGQRRGGEGRTGQAEEGLPLLDRKAGLPLPRPADASTLF
jgi:hypothetical protein